MRDCQESLLLLTPYSIRQPWPMWEAGAVGGMAIINSDPAAAPYKVVTPIRFNIAQDALPGPFVVTQAIDGRDAESLKKLLGDLMKRYDYAGAPQATFKAVLNDQVPSLAQMIKNWLDNAPPMVTEGMVTEWCNRLDQLRDQRRSSEVRYLHHWIRLMYEGPQQTEADRRSWSKAPLRETWDLRLHLRLAENYTIARQFKEAIEQYSLAAQLAPLDVFVLHRLAQVYLDTKDSDSARQTIDQVLRLDNNALKWNAEIAGLEGRYWKDEGRKCQEQNKPQQAQESFRKALQAYETAMDIDGVRVDFYMADNVGQLSLTLGDIPAAKRAYERARVALEGVTRETENVWSLATRANAALVLADENEAREYLARIRELEPTDSQKASISRGLQLISKALGKPDADYGRWVAALG
jgi:predicted negative regulator of RcsB-dependent stress response